MEVVAVAVVAVESCFVMGPSSRNAKDQRCSGGVDGLQVRSTVRFTMTLEACSDGLL